jgi:manganese-dependent ADP-ribose/CDP-alcohol diphosphatase
MLEKGKRERDINRRRPFADHEELNGGVGQEQMAWLERVVAQAHADGEKLIIATHAPLYPAVTMDGYAVCWNFTAVMDKLCQNPGQTVLCLSGHDHEGAHRVDARTGVHHVLLEAALESMVSEQSHAVIDVYNDRISIKGAGNVRSHELAFAAYSLYCPETQV